MAAGSERDFPTVFWCFAPSSRANRAGQTFVEVGSRAIGIECGGSIGSVAVAFGIVPAPRSASRFFRSPLGAPGGSQLARALVCSGPWFFCGFTANQGGDGAVGTTPQRFNLYLAQRLGSAAGRTACSPTHTLEDQQIGAAECSNSAAGPAPTVGFARSSFESIVGASTGWGSGRSTSREPKRIGGIQPGPNRCPPVGGSDHFPSQWSVVGAIAGPPRNRTHRKRCGFGKGNGHLERRMEGSRRGGLPASVAPLAGNANGHFAQHGCGGNLRRLGQTRRSVGVEGRPRRGTRYFAKYFRIWKLQDGVAANQEYQNTVQHQYTAKRLAPIVFCFGPGTNPTAVGGRGKHQSRRHHAIRLGPV